MSARMGHTGDVLDFGRLAGGFGSQLLIAGIGVRLQIAAELSQILLRPYAFAIGRVAIPRRRRSGSAPWRLIDQINPQPPRRRPTSPWRQHPDRRVVGVDHARSHHLEVDEVVDRFAPPGERAHPFAHRRTGYLDAAAGQDRRLAVVR